MQMQIDRSEFSKLGKLQGKIVLITGDDLDMGRSVAILFAREGADIIINYQPQEQKQASDTSRYIRAEGRRCFMIPGNLQDTAASKVLIEKSLKPFGRIDILINSRSERTNPALEEELQGAHGC